MSSDIVEPTIIGSEKHMPGKWGKCDITECHNTPNAKEAKKCIVANGCKSHAGPWKIGWCPTDGTIRTWDSRYNKVDCGLLPDTVPFPENYCNVSPTRENYVIHDECYYGVL